MILQHIDLGRAAQRVVLPRRSFLTGLTGLIAAPAVVRASALMPIKVWTPPRELWRIPSSQWTDAEWDAATRALRGRWPSQWTEIEWRLAEGLGVCID
jgi:hypothetical protein